MAKQLTEAQQSKITEDWVNMFGYNDDLPSTNFAAPPNVFQLMRESVKKRDRSIVDKAIVNKNPEQIRY